MAMSPNELRKLAKFLGYTLGRRPDAFGLVPDAEGFVKIKTLLQGLQGDPEWRHVRQGDLQMVALTEQPAPIEIQEAQVRATDRAQLPKMTLAQELPKLLYTTVRRRAYPAVHANGIGPIGGSHVMLTTAAQQAEQIGRRWDNAPVVLTVQVAEARAAGVVFHCYGDALFLADGIPVGAFTGPPLPKVPPAKAAAEPSPRPKTPGSFFPDISALAGKGDPERSERIRRDEASWKKDRRRARREKERERF